MGYKPMHQHSPDMEQDWKALYGQGAYRRRFDSTVRILDTVRHEDSKHPHSSKSRSIRR